MLVSVRSHVAASSVVVSMIRVWSLRLRTRRRIFLPLSRAWLNLSISDLSLRLRRGDLGSFSSILTCRCLIPSRAWMRGSQRSLSFYHDVHSH